MRRPGRAFLLLTILLAAALAWWLKVDRGVPLATLDGDIGVTGRHPRWVAEVHARGRSGLRAVEVRLTAGEQQFSLARRDFPSTGWFGSGVDSTRIPIEADLARLGVPEGAALVEVLAETHGWSFFQRGTAIAGSFQQTIDRTPPRVEILSQHHNTRVGGTVAAVLRLADDVVDVDVRIGEYRFPVRRDYFAQDGLGLAIFAIPQDVTADAEPFIHAVDAAGNSADVPIATAIKPREFRNRVLEIDDSFLRRKVPPLLAAQGLPDSGDMVRDYLTVNREVRARSEAQLRAATLRSHPTPLWTGVFQRMSRSQTMSEFGDRRSYSYGGEIIDRQTHLGIDLASLERAEVGASQAGIVVFAGDLGIYGDTVVIDHGVDVFTVYGHLSSMAVAVGDAVEAGQTLGRTGQTGLAGGDHLHFSVYVQGVHVDPIEWWDAKWMRERMAAKLEMFPRRGQPAPESDDGQEAT